MKIKFEDIPESGHCLTPCPHGLGCMVNSYACSKCMNYFGLAKDNNEIKSNYVKCNRRAGC